MNKLLVYTLTGEMPLSFFFSAKSSADISGQSVQTADSVPLTHCRLPQRGTDHRGNDHHETTSAESRHLPQAVW